MLILGFSAIPLAVFHKVYDVIKHPTDLGCLVSGLCPLVQMCCKLEFGVAYEQQDALQGLLTNPIFFGQIYHLRYWTYFFETLELNYEVFRTKFKT